jgi:prepilin-type N-terminal cleavage/methylation domain-containing protein
VGRARHDSGFTLLEILFAILLIAMVSAVLITNLGRGFGIQLRNAGRALAAELEYAGQRAVARGVPQRWVVDLDRQLFRLEEQSTADPALAAALPAGEQAPSLQPPLDPRSFQPVPDRRGEWRELDDVEIGIDEVVVRGESSLGGEVAITFAPDGGADAADIWLHDPSGHDLRVRVVAFTGEIEVREEQRGRGERG